MSKMKRFFSTRFGVGSAKSAKTSKIRILQWNVLADGLGEDGFLTTEFSPIYESSEEGSKSYDAREFMKMVREAKESDRASGMAEKFSRVKKEEKKLKKMQPADEGFDELKETISKMKEETDKSELVKLKRQFQKSPQLERVDREILDWNMRYDRLKAIVLRADADVLTFQEIDHVKQFLSDEQFSSLYTCMVDKAKSYQPPRYTHTKQEDDLRPSNYFQHILHSRAAFAPKSYSNAHLFRTKRGLNSADVDDDGSVVFWKKDLLKPVELGFLRVPSDNNSDNSEAVLAVTLQHIKTGDKINVITTHLPSGDEPKKELERLAVLENPSAEWTARRICLQDSSWTEVPYEDSKRFVGITSYVKYFAQRKEIDSSRTIFALDANSRPSFPRIKPDPDSSSAETNVWDTILEKTGLESIWVQNSLVKKSGEPFKPEHPFVASVNKMRGPSSNQPSKIGEHQLELIDHVFTNGTKSKVLKRVELSGKNYVPTAPLLYKSKEDAELNLYPSSKMPSDHLPVVVEITL